MKLSDMTLEQFANLAGCRITECGPGWGGKYGYITDDAPNHETCGFRTKKAALECWMDDTFGEKVGAVVRASLKPTAKEKAA